LLSNTKRRPRAKIAQLERADELIRHADDASGTENFGATGDACPLMDRLNHHSQTRQRLTDTLHAEQAFFVAYLSDRDNSVPILKIGFSSMHSIVKNSQEVLPAQSPIKKPVNGFLRASAAFKTPQLSSFLDRPEHLAYWYVDADNRAILACLTINTQAFMLGLVAHCNFCRNVFYPLRWRSG